MEKKQINGFDFMDTPATNCPKCNREIFSFEFIPKDAPVVREGRKATYLETIYGADKEYLLIHCETCRYMYLTNCLDHKDSN
jgi:hypothetical protein